MDKKKRLTLDSQAVYKIRVQGDLSERWSNRMGGAEIIVLSQSGEAPVTELTGDFMDQAALIGVVNTLYDLQLPLLSIKCIDIQSENQF